MLTSKKELEQLMQKRKTKNNMLKLYELTKANRFYIIYFIYKNDLYRTITKTLDNKTIIKSKSSSHKDILKLQLNNSNKLNYIINNPTTEKIMNAIEFEKLNKQYNNKGRTTEKIEYTRNNQETSYKLDNVRYDKDGDITIDNIKYQIKFENATITTYDTILKVVNETINQN